jgi:hypothetical protein
MEFYAQCVYCRALDQVKGADDFGVDHYRPTSIPIFRNLETEYLNLYYCCNRCNRLKRNYWPSMEDQAGERFIPNPCEHSMFQHLRYKRGEVTHASPAGEFTIRRLDLNDPQAVGFRDAFISMLARLNSDMVTTELLLADARTKVETAQDNDERRNAEEAVSDALQVQLAQNALLENAIGPLTLAFLRTVKA